MRAGGSSPTRRRHITTPVAEHHTPPERHHAAPRRDFRPLPSGDISGSSSPEAEPRGALARSGPELPVTHSIGLRVRACPGARMRSRSQKALAASRLVRQAQRAPKRSVHEYVSTGAQPQLPGRPPLGQCPSGTPRRGPFARGGSRPALHARRERIPERVVPTMGRHGERRRPVASHRSGWRRAAAALPCREPSASPNGPPRAVRGLRRIEPCPRWALPVAGPGET